MILLIQSCPTCAGGQRRPPSDSTEWKMEHRRDCVLGHQMCRGGVPRGVHQGQQISTLDRTEHDLRFYFRIFFFNSFSKFL